MAVYSRKCDEYCKDEITISLVYIRMYLVNVCVVVIVCRVLMLTLLRYITNIAALLIFYLFLMYSVGIFFDDDDVKYRLYRLF